MNKLDSFNKALTRVRYTNDLFLEYGHGSWVNHYYTIVITHFDGEEYDYTKTFSSLELAEEYLNELLVRGYDAHLLPN